MKVLMINGSTRKEGSTRAVLGIMEEILKGQGLGTEIFWVGNQPVRDCTGCRTCRKTRNNTCVFDDDDVNELIGKCQQADGFVFGTPVYYSSPTGALLSVLDRVYYAAGDVLRGKPGCSLAVARRGGTTLALQVLNQYFLYNEMPLVSGSYWAMAHGTSPEEVVRDIEGIQVISNMARNLAYTMKALKAAQETGLEKPRNEYGARTNFIR
ncbi:MAG: flavodoxin family protein [Eubacteriales bacterium]|jgi:multimeric flavodoxin WrbA|nr:flavodoxin family protein [Eubacteriales bacterium]